tara:strand:- start:729 stop:1439 length:711 start_codon:yes stop_codon:yes gene_type:complete
MEKLRNWDNKTWLSSKKYISSFNNFLKKKVKFKKNTKVLDIGCGRANIISSLHKKYKFRYKPVGIDIVKNKNIRKNIIFKKFDGVYYLSKIQTKYDLILIKQTIHLINQKKLNTLLNLIKKRLNSRGKLLIFSLKTKDNNIPCFKKMKDKFEKSLIKDASILKVIKKNLKKSKDDYFKYRVKVKTKKYIKMIRSRYISCLLNLSNKDIKDGIEEIKLKYKKKINFTDTLKCVSFSK